MVIDVSDKSSNLNDLIANAAKILGRSNDRRKVFASIYNGKKKIKTKDEIHEKTGLSHIRVLQEGWKLTANQIVEPLKVKGQTAYRKISFYSHHKKTILKLAANKQKLSNFPTKVNPRLKKTCTEITVKYLQKSFDVVKLTIDDLDSFSKLTKLKMGSGHLPIIEKKFKEGIKTIIGESGKFVDWGGEKNDLFTTKIRYKGRRMPCAFAFKGKGQKGILKPHMMGKNGDQIPRLFQSEADIFVLQYWGQIDQSVYELINSLAIAKSALTQKKVYYCVIDGDDTLRIIDSYPSCFE